MELTLLPSVSPIAVTIVWLFTMVQETLCALALAHLPHLDVHLPGDTHLDMWFLCQYSTWELFSICVYTYLCLYIYICLYIFFFWGRLCNLDWPWTWDMYFRLPSASIKVCTTTLDSYYIFSFVCVCVCVCVWLGFEFRTSHLQSRHSTAWATLLVHFILLWLF
jgi:hypothetical protein